MKKTVLAIIFVMMLALAVTASAEVETFTPDSDGLYTIDFDLADAGLSDVEDGTMFGMVVIEAAEGAEFALTEGSIRYIDQGEAADGALVFSGFAPMDLKEDGQYQVYIGGEGLSAATQIGILGEAAGEDPDPGEDPEEPAGVLGDINGDETVDINDATELFNHSMLPEFFPIAYTGNTDFEADGVLDINDATYLFNYSMLPDFFPISW